MRWPGSKSCSPLPPEVSSGQTGTVRQRIRKAVRVEVIVRCVGFRPFVYTLASGLSLGGLVGNDADGVFAEVEGPAAAVDQFRRRLTSEAPPLARVDRVRSWPLEPGGLDVPGFSIVSSPERSGPPRALVSPDTATCANCLRELADPADRRFGYPFINCTNCGPRFTIVRDVPYDRARTTMAPFTMCAACAAEYRAPANRRFHAEPTCCAACGPTLACTGPDGAARPGDPIAAAAQALRAARIVAVKGLGGYHLAADATSEPATSALRHRKHREDKPFAVMVPDLPAARTLVEVSPTAAGLLTSPARPIVLLPRR